MGSENLEAPATTTAAGEPLPPDCDGEIDWTLFTFSHGFRQPRTAALPVRLVSLFQSEADSVPGKLSDATGRQPMTGDCRDIQSFQRFALELCSTSLWIAEFCMIMEASPLTWYTFKEQLPSMPEHVRRQLAAGRFPSPVKPARVVQRLWRLRASLRRSYSAGRAH